MIDGRVLRYVNHALDETTLKIATNTWVTWLSLILLILLTAQVDQDAFFMGTNQRGYYNFLAMGLLLVFVHLGLYGVVSWQSERLMQKLGAKGDVEQEFKVCVCRRGNKRSRFVCLDVELEFKVCVLSFAARYRLPRNSCDTPRI